MINLLFLALFAFQETNLEQGYSQQAYRFEESKEPQAPIDPELMLRMLIVGYCYGIRSERRLCEEDGLHLGQLDLSRRDGRARVGGGSLGDGPPVLKRTRGSTCQERASSPRPPTPTAALVAE